MNISTVVYAEEKKKDEIANLFANPALKLECLVIQSSRLKHIWEAYYTVDTLDALRLSPQMIGDEYPAVMVAYLLGLRKGKPIMKAILQADDTFGRYIELKDLELGLVSIQYSTEFNPGAGFTERMLRHCVQKLQS